MNNAEKRMVEQLKELREVYGAHYVKTEFEGEGISIEDFFRQKDITARAQIPLAVKIGGGEAITDLKLTKLVGVNKVIGPMLESAFAVEKYVEAVHKVYTEDELSDLSVGINIETITAYRNYDDITSSSVFGEIDSVAIGRKDLTFSMGLTRKNMDGDAVNKVVDGILLMTNKANPKCCGIVGGLGGGLSSIERLKSFGGLLGGYETRKLIFDVSALDYKPLEGMKKALQFELLYYTNKAEKYNYASHEDDAYILRLQNKLEQ